MPSYYFRFGIECYGYIHSYTCITFLSLSKVYKENLKMSCDLIGFVVGVYFSSIKGDYFVCLCEARWKRGSINVKPRLASGKFVFVYFVLLL